MRSAARSTIPGFTPSELIDDLVERTRRRIAAETELLTRPARIRAAEPDDRVDVLQIVALLHGLGSDRRAVWALTELARDDDRGVAVTAAYVLELRGARQAKGPGDERVHDVRSERSCPIRGRFASTGKSTPSWMRICYFSALAQFGLGRTAQVI